ncbi:MAG: hypothetical protein ACE366_21860 [Bradymonadia bacterium]
MYQEYGPGPDLAELLYNARLLDVVHTHGELSLVLDCLRREVDGRPMKDRRVHVTLRGVAAVAASYDTLHLQQKPSTLETPAPIVIDSLERWHTPTWGVSVDLNLPEQVECLTWAPRVDWLVGDRRRYDVSILRLQIALGDHPLVSPKAKVTLNIGAERWRALAGEAPLSRLQWSREYEAWWAAQDSEGEHVEVEQSEPPNLFYRPPEVPPFTIADPSGEGLLEPVRLWHEGLHRRLWRQMASAFPHPNRAADVHAMAIRDACTGAGFGRWGYVDTLDGWWIEANRGCVVVSGREHIISAGAQSERPAWWCYGLRRTSGGWIIYATEQDYTPIPVEMP